MSSSSFAAGVLVVGSLNTDFTVQVERLPRPGETLCVPDAVVSFGGKGANQAVQLRLLEVPVTFVGAVGADDRGRGYLRWLDSLGVDLRVAQVDNGATGLGFVHCTPEGTVSATVISGANWRVSPMAVDAAFAAGPKPGLLLTQNEVPADVVIAAGRLARDMDVPAVLNAAPYVPYGDELHGLFRYLVVNEEEALAYAGCKHAPEDLTGWQRLAVGLQRISPEVIVTLGGAGSVYAGAKGQKVIPAHHVSAVDTTGAGDSFVGTMCAALVRGQSIDSALRYATIAGALTTMAAGAQESMPDTAQVFGLPAP